MEPECILVSSRGILKSCNVHSQSPKSSDPTDLTHAIQYVTPPHQQRPKTTIYICTDALKAFVRTVLPKMTATFILVTGDSDLTVPYEALSVQEYAYLLKHPLLLAWYAQNAILPIGPPLGIPNGQSPTKLHPLPIGMDYHTLLPMQKGPLFHKWGIRANPQTQEQQLYGIRQTASSTNRLPKIFSNMHFALDRWGDRQQALNTIPQELLMKQQNHQTRQQTWQEMVKYQFVVSPKGNGFDCHRTWEALALGCIPIVCGDHFTQLFEGLPVLVVTKWSDITQDLLAQTREKYAGKVDIILPKMHLSYWMKRINTAN